MHGRIMQRDSVLARAGILTPVVFWVTLVAADLLRRGYNPIRQYRGELGVTLRGHGPEGHRGRAEGHDRGGLGAVAIVAALPVAHRGRQVRLTRPAKRPDLGRRHRVGRVVADRQGAGARLDGGRSGRGAERRAVAWALACVEVSRRPAA